MNEWFRRVANAVSEAAGTPWAFIVALGIILFWIVTGPIFAFSDTWQLIINTGTTIVTFLMVFLIQNTQNRDAKAVHLKLDELLRGVEGARTRLMDLENLTDEELDQLQAQFQQIRNRVAEGESEAEVLQEVEKAEEQLEEAAEPRGTTNKGD
jgi:low affinity Fe/Cu permease